MVYQWTKNLQSWLFPPVCLLCRASGEADRDLCTGCHIDLPRNCLACRRCALPLAAHPQATLICGQCQSHPPPFARTLAPFLYRSPLDFLIQDLKFHARLTTARLLGGLLSEALERQGGPLPECIIPVPLHPTRLRERGFNQALELARPVARRLDIPLLSDRVKRIRLTPAQSQLDLNARRENLRGAFFINRAIQARHVAIFDDVITTGSTVLELARVLRKAGVEEIEVWACARTPVR